MLGTAGGDGGTRKATPCGGLWEGIGRDPKVSVRWVEGLWRVCDDVTTALGHPSTLTDVT